MADEATPEPDAIDPETIRDAFTSRELGLWEQTVGVSLPEFGSAYMAAMLSWWAAKQDAPQDKPVPPPDVFQDKSLGQLAPYMERATELLGKAPTGEPTPSGTSTANGSEDSPDSDISTTSPSPASRT
jgi:hypothetical protein